MNIEPLLTDSVFGLIEREYIKRSKKRNGPLGEQDYKIALEALIKRICEVIPEAANSIYAEGHIGDMVKKNGNGHKQQPAFELSNLEAPATAEEKEEIKRIDALNSTENTRAKYHEKIFQLAKPFFDAGRWDAEGKMALNFPKQWGGVSEIMPFLRERGCHFSDMQAMLIPVMPGVEPTHWQLVFTR